MGSTPHTPVSRKADPPSQIESSLVEDGFTLEELDDTSQECKELNVGLMNLRPSSSQGDIQESDDEDTQGRIYDEDAQGTDDIDEAKCFLDESVVSSPCSVNGQERSSLLAFEGVANDRSDGSPGIQENEDPVELPKASSKHQSPGKQAKESTKDSSIRKSTPNFDPKGTTYHGARRAVNSYQRNQDSKRLQDLIERGNSRERADEARRNEEAAREARTAANRLHKARQKAAKAEKNAAAAAADN